MDADVLEASRHCSWVAGSFESLQPSEPSCFLEISYGFAPAICLVYVIIMMQIVDRCDV